MGVEEEAETTPTSGPNNTMPGASPSPSPSLPNTTITTTTTTTATSTDQEKKDEGKEPTNTVPFLKLFHFADSYDHLLMIIGTIGAVGNGLCLPLMTILFGELTDSFGQTQGDIKQVVRVVSKVKSQHPTPLTINYICQTFIDCYYTVQ